MVKAQVWVIALGSIKFDLIISSEYIPGFVNVVDVGCEEDEERSQGQHQIIWPGYLGGWCCLSLR